MKKIVLAIFATVLSFFGFAQTYVQEGNTFVQQKTERKVAAKQEPTKTSYTWKDKRGNEYPIMINQKTGSCYVIKTSQKTGKEYKQYLDADLCAKIAKEYGIEYTPKKKKEDKE